MRKFEQPLSVGLCLTRKPGYLRQTRPDQGDGKSALNHLVERSNEGLQFGGGKELHLIEEEDHTRVMLPSGFADSDEKLGEVLIEMPGIGETFSRNRRPAPR